MNCHLVPLAVNYLDGAEETAGVGAALWLSDGDVVVGCHRAPDDPRELWMQKASLEDDRDVFQIEAAEPSLVLLNGGHRIANYLSVRLEDNEGPPAALA